jgi:hypothetical protein
VCWTCVNNVGFGEVIGKGDGVGALISVPMPNLRFGSARTSPVLPKANLWFDGQGASRPPLGSGADYATRPRYSRHFERRPRSLEPSQRLPVHLEKSFLRRSI